MTTLHFPLCHHVLFWLKDPADTPNFLRALQALAAIPSIRGGQLGVPAATAPDAVIDATYSVSLLLFFEDLAGEAAYQAHPTHQAFIENHAHWWAKVVVYDTMVASLHAEPSC